MNTPPIQPSNDGLDPDVAALLVVSDPYGNENEAALARSRAHTAAIPAGDYVQVIPQRSTFSPRAAQRSVAQRWGMGLALVAAGAVFAGVVAFGPWSHQLPQLAAPGITETIVPAPSSTAFDPTITSQLTPFHEAGGKRITGLLRRALPSDAAELQSTGWLLNTYVVAGEGDPEAFGIGLWSPIDLQGRDTSLLGVNSTEGDIVVVFTKQSNLSLIIPEPGPYGIMVSDQKKLVENPPAQAVSLMTLDGTYLQEPDVDLNGAMLLQFATFTMAYSYSDDPATKPTAFKATAFNSYTNEEAVSCISAVTASGHKILSFPAGSTASGSIDGEVLPTSVAAQLPLRIMPPDGWGSEGDESMFILDTPSTVAKTISGWPTGKSGSCGEFTGEIVKFSGIK